MQLFILSHNIEENASWHMDSHILKLPAEIQHLLLLSCVRGGIKYPNIKTWGGMPVVPDRKKLHHPLVKWASLDESNFLFIKRLGLQLCHEYQLRWGNLHNYLGNLLMFPDFVSNKPPMWSRFPVTVPMFMRCPERSLIETHRAYYVECKHHLARWHSPRIKPEWFPQSQVEEGMKIAAAYERAKAKGVADFGGLKLAKNFIPDTE